MLGDKDRMPPHRRLAAVVQRLGGSQPLRHKVARVFGNDSDPALGKIGPLLVSQAEARAEARARQPGEDLIEVTHRDKGGTLDAICQRRYAVRA